MTFFFRKEAKKNVFNLFFLENTYICIRYNIQILLKMKAKYTLLPILLLTAGISFTSCKGKKEKTDQPQNTSMVQEVFPPDSALYGKLGEGTGMSCIEVITDQGDTLILNKINETTGEAGVLLGGTEHYNDRLTVTTDIQKENILTLVNLNTLTGKWQDSSAQTLLTLEKEGKARANWNGKKYSRWRMYNAHLLLDNPKDNAEGYPCDTFEIQELNRDSLVMSYQDTTFTFYSKTK